MKPSEFIAKLAPIANQDMRQYGVPASLTLAQAILDSNWGLSGLTHKANNLFG
ncbi:mannosyl-glycoprotein endo-beta-N-acetylglucosamidase, partial [Clostridium perfringens]